MALQRGNRTYYNPVHGIEWRGGLLPLNTLYALLAFCLMIVLGIILKVCYMGYRAEIHRLEDKKLSDNMVLANKKQVNGHPMSILKTSNGIQKCTQNKAVKKDNTKTDLKVKFVKGERSDVEPCKVGEYRKIDYNEQENYSLNDCQYFSCHL